MAMASSNVVNASSNSPSARRRRAEAAADEALDVKYVNAAAAVDDDGGLSSLPLALAVADEVDILGGGMAEEEDADAGGANVNEAPKASAADTEGVTGVAAALVAASSSSLPVNFDIISVGEAAI